MRNVVKMIVMAPLILIGLLLFITIGGFLVMALWNWLLPPLFGWPHLSFWQALALLALCRILFGGFGMRGSPGSRVRRRVAERVSERLDDLPPEKRERFRQAMRERCGMDPALEKGEEV